MWLRDPSLIGAQSACHSCFGAMRWVRSAPQFNRLLLYPAITDPQYTLSGHDPELVARIVESRLQVLALLKTRHAEELMYVKSVIAQREERVLALAWWGSKESGLPVLVSSSLVRVRSYKVHHQ
ncbi:hypothetical protein TNCV_1359311 [Trichonephila clavipes]|nr:hypothetical protein TNCV_1359311 [Trichonephila clavipes]